jgi:hypothetical protein
MKYTVILFDKFFNRKFSRTIYAENINQAEKLANEYFKTPNVIIRSVQSDFRKRKAR